MGPRRSRSGPAHTPVHERTEQAQLARSQDRAGDAARRNDAEPLGRERTGGLHERADRDRHEQPVACPDSSKVGTVTIETPTCRQQHAHGDVYLATQENQEPDHRAAVPIFLDAEKPPYGCRRSARRPGQRQQPSTGRLTATVATTRSSRSANFDPEFQRRPRAPLANPLLCAPTPLSSLISYTGQPGTATPLSSPFTAGTGSVCATSAPFALTQSATPANTTAGAYSPYTFNLTRTDGQQYLSQVTTTLPAGLLGDDPVGRALRRTTGRGRARARRRSQIGVANVTAGAGAEPYPFSGPVYLTGPYDGAPYGLSIVVPGDRRAVQPRHRRRRARRSPSIPHTARVTVDRRPTCPPSWEGCRCA